MSQLFDETEFTDHTTGGNGVCDSAPSGGGSVTGMQSHFPSTDQPELDLGIPSEEEAHEVWVNSDGKDSLSGWARIALSPFNYGWFDTQELLQGLRIEGRSALLAWKKERGASLKNYTIARMKRRLPRLLSQLNANDMRQVASQNQLQKFDAIKANDDLDGHQAKLDEWERTGEDGELFKLLNQRRVYADSRDHGDNGEGAVDPTQDPWDALIGFTPSHNSEEDLICHKHSMNELWTQGFDADDFRVLEQRQSDPDASAREIGRLLGHTHKWVIARINKIEEAGRGFQREQGHREI